MAALRGARQSILKTWIAAADTLPKKPLPNLGLATDATVIALTGQLRDRIEEIIKTLITDAINNLVLYPLQGGKSAWNDAKSHLPSTPALNDAYKAVNDQLTNVLSSVQQQLAKWPPSTGDAALAQSRALELLAFATNKLDIDTLKALEKGLLDGAISAAAGRQLSEIEPQLNKYAAAVLDGIGYFYDRLIEVRQKSYQAVKDSLGPDGADLTHKLFGDPTKAVLGDDGCFDREWHDYIFLLPNPSLSCSPQNDGLTDERKELKNGANLEGYVGHDTFSLAKKVICRLRRIFSQAR